MYPDAPPKPVQKSLCYDFPLRPDYDAQLVIPRNLSMQEAERLAEFLKSIAAAASVNGAESHERI